MDFRELLNVADSNKSEALSEASIKRYSTTFTAPKKPPKSGVQSSAVMRFLAKKKREEQQIVLEAQKKKEELLALRSQNSKNSKKAKIMASRTKDNDFSRIRLTEDEVEAKKKREAEILRMQLNDKVERMKARIEMEEKEMLLPRKRKRKSKHGDAVESNPNCDEESYHISNPEETASQKKMSRKLRKEMELERILAEMASEKKKKPYAKDMNKKNKPPPPPHTKSSYQNFNDLLQLASQKQHEPVKLPEVEVNDSNNRPLTKKERALYYEEQARTQRRLQKQNAVPSQPVTSKTCNSQGGVPKKNKSMHNVRVVDQNNNNSVRKNLHQDQTISDYKISKNEKPQHNGQMKPPISQKELYTSQKTSSQKELYTPQKTSSQKHPSHIPKTEPRAPSRHPSPIPKAKNFSNSNKYPVDNVKSYSIGNVPEQMPKRGGSSRPDYQNSNIKNNVHSVSSCTQVQNHKVISPKQQINGLNKKPRLHQSQDVHTEKPQKKLNHSSDTSSRPEKSSNVQFSKNPKHTFNKESIPSKQQLKKVNEEVNEECVFDDLFMPGEALLRTEKGNYVQSSKNSKHTENKGNKPSPFGPPGYLKHSKSTTVQESMRGTQPAQISPSKKSKSIQNTHTSTFNERISDKQPVPHRNKVYRTPDGRSDLGKHVVSGKEPPKMPVNTGLKNHNNSLPSKNVYHKQPPPSHSEKNIKRVPSFDNAKALKQRVPDERTATGKVAPVHRPLSAKAEMRKPPSIPPARSSNSRGSKHSAAPRPFHINPYLDAPRRLLEPQRPQKPPMKRRIESDDDDDDDDDDDMSDFIDDGPCYDDTNYSEHIKEIFRYDRSKYFDDDDDDDDMETSFAEQMKEEIRSAKLGYLEDLEDMKQEEEEKKRKMMKKKRLKS